MKILYAASEAAPFAKSGGLADVAGALPKALVRDGIDARVVMPLYGDLKFKDTLTYVTNFSVPVGWRSQYCGLFKGVDKKTRLARARKELKSMGLLGRANHLPTEMSGGQQQRVGIARAFVSSPKVIFADEPTGNLDSRTSKQVLYRMLEMSKNSGVTFVMVTHEPDLAECADRIVTILDGKVCSNVVQDEETKKKNRDALFADLEGNLDIGGEAAKEQKK